MPYSPLTHDSVFLHVFGEVEGLPLLESLINAHFEAVGLPLVHKLQLQPRDLPPEHQGEKLAILDLLAEDEEGSVINVEVQTTRKPAYFERALFYWARLFTRQLPEGVNPSGDRPRRTVPKDFHDFGTFSEAKRPFPPSGTAEVPNALFSTYPRSRLPACLWRRRRTATAGKSHQCSFRSGRTSFGKQPAIPTS